MILVVMSGVFQTAHRNYDQTDTPLAVQMVSSATAFKIVQARCTTTAVSQWIQVCRLPLEFILILPKIFKVCLQNLCTLGRQ